MTRRVVALVAAALVVGAASCGGGDDAAARPALDQIAPAVAAVEAKLGGPQQYFEINATPQLVNLFVADAAKTTVTPYVYVGGAVAEAGPSAGAQGNGKADDHGRDGQHRWYQFRETVSVFEADRPADFEQAGEKQKNPGHRKTLHPASGRNTIRSGMLDQCGRVVPTEFSEVRGRPRARDIGLSKRPINPAALPDAAGGIPPRLPRPTSL